MSKVRWTCTSCWEKSKRSRWLIYIMLTWTNSYWCFFINESDMAQTAWKGSQSSTEMNLCPNLDEYNSFISGTGVIFLLIQYDGWEVEILDFFVQLGNIFELELKSASVPLLEKKTWEKKKHEQRGNRNRAVCENEKWQGWNSSFALLSNHSPQLPTDHVVAQCSCLIPP